MNKEYDFSKGKRGAVVSIPPDQSRITLRLDNAVIEWFRLQVEEAGGGDYQELMNQALHEYIQRRQESLEELLRRVIREELVVPSKQFTGPQVGALVPV
ncbi:MAG: BrnA antitoxin family protein [Chloroflexota bacterium]